MRIKQLKEYLEKLPDRINKNATRVYKAELPKILQDLKNRSPVATGLYKSGWQMRTEGADKAVFFNTDHRASLFEFGADTNAAPWYYPKSRKTGKLTVSMSKVWAGGLKPGHQHTIGGAINPVLYNNKQRQQDLAVRISDAIIGKL